MTRQVFGIAGPITLWALHFIAIYALISAACAPRDLLAPEVLRPVAALLTAAVAVIALGWLMLAGRRLRRAPADAPDRPLAQAAWWTALIALLAVLANSWPVAMLTSCTG